MKIGCIKLLVTVGLMATCTVARALQIEPGIGAGMLYTDNAEFESENETDDLIAVGYLGAQINEDEGPFRAQIITSLLYQHYIDDTFGDQYDVNFGGTANWEMVRERVDWQLSNYYTQQAVDSVEANTPNNRQDTNVFTFGPTVTWPISGRQVFTISPLFSDYYFEDDNSDNRQYSLNADWSYELKPALSVGLDGAVSQTKFDNSDDNPDFISSNFHGVIAGRQARSEYTVNLGVTHVKRDDFENQEGFTGDIDLLYRLTGRSSARAFLATELRDSGTGLSRSETDPDTGDFSNEQISGDVLRNNVIRLTYRREGSTLNAEAWTEYRDLDYKETDDDREVIEIGANLDYQVTPLVTTGVFGSFNRTEEQDTGLDNDTSIIGGNVVYMLSRQLRTRFELQYQDRDSNNSNDEFKEFSAFIGLVYGFRDLTRPGR